MDPESAPAPAAVDDVLDPSLPLVANGDIDKGPPLQGFRYTCERCNQIFGWNAGDIEGGCFRCWGCIH